MSRRPLLYQEGTAIAVPQLYEASNFQLFERGKIKLEIIEIEYVGYCYETMVFYPLYRRYYHSSWSGFRNWWASGRQSRRQDFDQRRPYNFRVPSQPLG